LNLCGIPTHYVNGGEDDDDNEMLVRRCTMIPLEVVVRGVAAGSFVKRNPAIARGTILAPRLIEFFFKDDANQIRRSRPTGSSAEHRHAARSRTMSELARLVFEILSHAWRKRDTLLVDLKVEFGRLPAAGQRPTRSRGRDRQRLVRIWPQAAKR